MIPFNNDSSHITMAVRFSALYLSFSMSHSETKRACMFSVLAFKNEMFFFATKLLCIRLSFSLENASPYMSRYSDIYLPDSF